MYTCREVPESPSFLNHSYYHVSKNLMNNNNNNIPCLYSAQYIDPTMCLSALQIYYIYYILNMIMVKVNLFISHIKFDIVQSLSDTRELQLYPCQKVKYFFLFEKLSLICLVAQRS